MSENTRPQVPHTADRLRAAVQAQTKHIVTGECTQLERILVAGPHQKLRAEAIRNGDPIPSGPNVYLLNPEAPAELMYVKSPLSAHRHRLVALADWITPITPLHSHASLKYSHGPSPVIRFNHYPDDILVVSDSDALLPTLTHLIPQALWPVEYYSSPLEYEKRRNNEYDTHQAPWPSECEKRR